MKFHRFRLLWVAVFLLGGSSAYSDTQVDPVISGQQTWTPAGSPYRISRDTRVALGAILTLQAGTVVVVSEGRDHTIPNITPNVDIVVQGRMEIQGTEQNPVKFVCNDPGLAWGAFYVASMQEMDWHHLDMQGGRMVVTGCRLTLEDCRLSSGEGIQAAAQAQVNLVRCQIDANKLGVAFLDPSAKVNLDHTRLWDNETSLYFKTAGTLTAVESSIAKSGKWNVVNATAAPVRIPVLWWGTKEPTEITGKVFDGNRRQGLGPVSFDGVAAADPFMAQATGYIPNADPRRRLWAGPKYLVGFYFQWLFPSLNVRLNGAKVPFASTLGYGGTVGWVVSPSFEMRAMVQSGDFSSSNAALNSHMDMTLVQTGIAGRYLVPLGRKKNLYAYGELGGLLTLDHETSTQPKDLDKPNNPPMVSNDYKETDMGLKVGFGVMTRLGRSYKADLGLHYLAVPLNDGRGGGNVAFQAGLAFYFR